MHPIPFQHYILAGDKMEHILKCTKCGKYTMKQECCGQKTINPKPAKFSPEDNYASYRRRAKEAERKKEGQI